MHSELCSDHFPTRLCWPGDLNQDTIVLLHGARQPPNYHYQIIWVWGAWNFDKLHPYALSVNPMSGIIWVGRIFELVKWIQSYAQIIFPSQLCRQWDLNQDPTVWLDGARPPSNYHYQIIWVWQTWNFVKLGPFAPSVIPLSGNVWVGWIFELVE